MPGDYDGGSVVFLPALLMVAVCWGVQQPADPYTVIRGDADVSAESMSRVADATRRALGALRPRFDGLPRLPFRVVLHSSAASLPANLAAGHHPGSPGMAVLDTREIHLLWQEMRAVQGDGVASVVTHEVVHILLHELAGAHGSRIPRWFHEGLAQVLAGAPYLGAREEDLIWRATARRLLYFSDLVDDFPRRETDLQLAYAQSWSFVAWLERRYGLDGLLDVIRRIDEDTSFSRALVTVTRESAVGLQDGWSHYLLYGSGARYRVLLDWCFPLSMVLALPLLALAMIRRLRADRRVSQRLDAQEANPTLHHSGIAAPGDSQTLPPEEEPR